MTSKTKDLVKRFTRATFFSADDMKRLALDEKLGDRISLFNIIGIAAKATLEDGDKGQFYKFIGQFEATNNQTGEIVRTSTVILPDVIANDIYAQLGGNDGDISNVQFAFEVAVKKSKSSIVGYEYIAAPLMEASENDPLEALRLKVADTLKIEDNSKKKAS